MAPVSKGAGDYPQVLHSLSRVKRTEALLGSNFGRNSPIDRAPKVQVGSLEAMPPAISLAL